MQYCTGFSIFILQSCSLSLFFDRIQQASHPLTQAVIQLYTEAFPANERRNENQLLSMLPLEEMELYAITVDNQFIGLLIVWNFGTFAFPEHFAINPQLRGKQYGSMALEWVRKQYPRLLFEVEKEHDGPSQRRIAFYERNHFHRLNMEYAQPPYRKGEKAIPMYLFSDNQSWEISEIAQAAATIEKEVYSRFR